MKKLSLPGNSRTAFISAEVAARAGNWCFLFLVAFWVETVEYGMLAVVVSLEAIISVLMLGGFDRAAMRFLAARDESVSLYTPIAAWALFCFLVVSICLLLELTFRWASGAYLNDWLFIYFMAGMVALAASRILSSVSRAQGDAIGFVLLRPVLVALKIFLFFVLYNAGLSIIAAYLLAVLASSLFPVMMQFGRTIKNRHDNLPMRITDIRIWRYAMPFLPHAVAAIVFAMVDRIMLDAYLGAEAAGTYNVGYMLGAALSLAYAIVAVNYERELFALAGDSRAVETFQQRYFKLLNHLGFLALIAVYLIARTIDYLDPRYSFEQTGVVGLMICLGYLLNVHYLRASYFLAVEKKTLQIAIASLIVMGANLLLNIYLIPAYALLGAALSSYLSFVLLSLIMLFMAARSTGFVQIDRQSIRFAVLALLASLCLLVSAELLLVFACMVVILDLKSTREMVVSMLLSPGHGSR